MRRVTSLLAVTLFVASFVGCGGSPNNMAPVSGKVTLDGQPLTVGSVTFIPDPAQDTKGAASAGVLNEQGEFTLAGPSGVKGAIIGGHKVLVECPFDASAGSSSGGTTEAPASTTPCEIPPVYGAFASTPLVFQVTEGQNEANFTLTTSP